MNKPTRMNPVEHTCPICGGGTMLSFLRIADAPAHIGVLWRDVESAIGCPKGEIHLCYCEACGFVYNVAFEAVRMTYEEGYDNALDFSAVFGEYAQGLAESLVERFDLRGKDIVDVGCGNGEFLKLLCTIGENRGHGFDPSAPAEADAIDRRITFTQDYYGRAYREQPVDFITSRHVFEHIDDPMAFLTELRETIGTRSVPVFFEVPSLRNIVRGNSPWEIIYEHCSYFGEEAMTRAFGDAGFDVEAATPLHNDLYLGLWASPGTPGKTSAGPDLPAGGLDGLRRIVEDFSGLFEAKIDTWNACFNDMKKDGRTAVAWGAGARGTSFVNILDVGDRIRYLVDINPRKHGKFVPGTGQEIVTPQRLVDIRPDVIIVMNPVYLEEIRETVLGLGLDAEFMTA